MGLHVGGRDAGGAREVSKPGNESPWLTWVSNPTRSVSVWRRLRFNYRYFRLEENSPLRAATVQASPMHNVRVTVNSRTMDSFSYPGTVQGAA